MSLIDRAKDEQFAKLVQDSEAAGEREERENDYARRRVEVITQRMEVVAKSLAEPLTTITETPYGLPRYYVLGDVVVMVQRFLNGGESPDPDQPHIVTFSYCTYVMAIDPERKLKSRKIGTLRFLDFAGIADAITNAPPGYEFNAEVVKNYLP